MWCLLASAAQPKHKVRWDTGPPPSHRLARVGVETSLDGVHVVDTGGDRPGPLEEIFEAEGDC